MKFCYYLFCKPWRQAVTAVVVAASFAPIVQADIALKWNETLEGVAPSAESLAPHLKARAYAMAHLAMDEAIASLGRAARPFTNAAAAQRVAASAAAHTVLRDVIPASAARFAAMHATQLATLPEGDERDRAERIGRDAAALVLEKRAGDGWLTFGQSSSGDSMVTNRSAQSAEDLAAGAIPARSPWSSMTPFILKKVGQFDAAVPHALDREGNMRTDPFLSDPRFFKSVDRNGAPEARIEAWSGDAVVAWNRVARAVIASRSLDLIKESRLLAMLNVTVADAIIAAQHWRFTLGSWRSLTAEMWEDVGQMPERSTDIVALLDGGIGTATVRREPRRVLIPPLPDFPSMASTIAGAAQAALELGTSSRGAFTVARGTAWRKYTNFSEAALECAFVASLDGRHCREACVSGYQLGSAIGNYVAKRAVARR